MGNLFEDFFDNIDNDDIDIINNDINDDDYDYRLTIEISNVINVDILYKQLKYIFESINLKTSDIIIQLESRTNEPVSNLSAVNSDVYNYIFSVYIKGRLFAKELYAFISCLFKLKIKFSKNNSLFIYLFENIGDDYTLYSDVKKVLTNCFISSNAMPNEEDFIFLAPFLLKPHQLIKLYDIIDNKNIAKCHFLSDFSWITSDVIKKVETVEIPKNFILLPELTKYYDIVGEMHGPLVEVVSVDEVIRLRNLKDLKYNDEKYESFFNVLQQFTSEPQLCDLYVSEHYNMFIFTSRKSFRTKSSEYEKYDVDFIVNFSISFNKVLSKNEKCAEYFATIINILTQIGVDKSIIEHTIFKYMSKKLIKKVNELQHVI